MPRQKVTVYLVKHLSWCYNDNYTVPFGATFEKAFRSRERAELYRREMEIEARGSDDPGSEGDEPLQTLWDLPRVRAWLVRYGLAEPPLDPIDEQYDWNAAWLARAEAQLGHDEFVRFCELFDRGSYFYHIIETEMEL